MDADHLAAVSTFVSAHARIGRACLLGTFWGVGHTLSLLIAGLVVVIFKLVIPPAVERAFEVVVALVLVLLGGAVLRRAIGSLALHTHAHQHGDLVHSHVHVHGASAHAHGHVHLFRFGLRPLLVGMLHGMAGSAALTVLAVATIPSVLGVLAYLLVFGVGSLGGMLLVSGAMVMPLALAARRARLHGLMQAAAGAISLLLGLWLLWEHTQA